ncbi:MAG: filamentous hemagglutinin N-terminal domain-containing protein [Acaryochloridaceae cyanobacterium RU_4_10]|nr:filamentous hemagglutinin N-terminal domain-containing protein [Acaryochloridaceae cyanobacterium RU_4_10]
MKSHLQNARLALLVLPLLLSFGTKGALAQITSAPDGTGTIVRQAGQNIDISGGTQVGGNQFHSFQQFGVNAGQTATFLANPNSVNIVGRVTGGDPSFINGLLRVTGSNANLYLMNPAGIVFGKGASLNVPAAFTATTANSIGFGNGQWFNAFGSNNYAALTGNPNSFGFVGASGSLINAGNLAVNPGQQISLIGGTVINTGTIEAPGGTITVAAVPGEKLVRIGQAGTVLSLDLPTSDKTLINAPSATPLSLPELLTGGTIPPAMGVVVEDGVVKLTGGSAAISGTLSADGVGSQNGGNVVAYADNRLDFSGTISAKGGELGGNGGFVETSGKGLIGIDPNAKVVTTALKGEMGTWLIDPADLEVITDGGTGTISGASTFEAGALVTALDGTNVTLQADNSITVNAAIDASGNSSNGDLSLNAPTTNLNEAITLNGSLSGTATTVNVGANGTVQNGIDAVASAGTVNLAATTYTLGDTVYIDKDVTVKGAGSSSTTVSGDGEVQVFHISNDRTVTLDSIAIVDGYSIYGGGIYNDGGTLTVSNSTLSENSAVQYGGGISNAKKGVLALNNSTISGNFTNDEGGEDGVGGIANYGISIVSNSTFSGNSTNGDGGGILNASGTLTVNNSTLGGNSAQYGGGIAMGGTLTIDNSTLSGNTATYYGGGIFNYGNLTIDNSTISGNSVTYSGEGGEGEGEGGGIWNYGNLTVSNSTISGNSAMLQGGGISTYSRSSAKIGNSIVAGNTASTGREIYNNGETFTSNGYNLFGYSGDSGLFGVETVSTDIIPTVALNKIIAPLGNYGGPTQTHALVPGSVAINAGDPTITTADQRGVAPVGTRDIGAYESKRLCPPCLQTGNQSHKPSTQPLPTPSPSTSLKPPLVVRCPFQGLKFN